MQNNTQHPVAENRDQDRGPEPTKIQIAGACSCFSGSITNTGRWNSSDFEDVLNLTRLFLILRLDPRQKLLETLTATRNHCSEESSQDGGISMKLHQLQGLLQISATPRVHIPLLFALVHAICCIHSGSESPKKFSRKHQKTCLT